MKKKRIANIVMAVIILAIVTSGILGAGYVKGWFDKESDGALLTEHIGIIELERNGVAYTVTEDTVLRTGDRISCDVGATVVIKLTDGYLTLGQNAVTVIEDPNPDAPILNVEKGEVFVNVNSVLSLGFDSESLEIKDSVAALSVRKGASSLSIYHGAVDGARAGEMIEWIGGEKSLAELNINSLTDFNINQLKAANGDKELVFTLEMLDELILQRQAQLYAPETKSPPEITDETNDTTEIKESEETEQTTVIPEETETTEYIEEPIPDETEVYTQTQKPTETTKPIETTETTKSIETTKPEETTKPKETEPPIKTEPSEPEPKGCCTVTIRCDTILDNMGELDSAKAPFVPSDGCILPVISVDFYEGETVFDVLNRVCKQYGIQIEYSWTPLYDSYYIEGINNLYEFDCGYESGWMYMVNGWFPNYGCSSYTLTDGDTIVWCYTCKGLGEDVGASGW